MRWMTSQSAEFLNPIIMDATGETEDFVASHHIGRSPVGTEMSHADTVHAAQSIGYTIIGQKGMNRPK